MFCSAGVATSDTGLAPVDMRAVRMPVIELIGTPGAGKTTLCPEIIDRLHERGWRPSTIVDAARDHARRTPAGRVVARCTRGAVRRLLLWWLFYVLATAHAAAFVFEHPRLSRTVIRTQLRRPLPLARRLHVCFWFFQLGGRQRFLRGTAREREVLVVDDGFVHRAVHLFASHNERTSHDLVDRYIDSLAEPALVVHVRCDQETCEDRVRRRGVWRHSRRLTVGELSRYLIESEHVTTSATRRARQRGWPVVEVDNGDSGTDGPREELVAALAATFPEITRAGWRAPGAAG
jgi:AAA domain